MPGAAARAVLGFAFIEFAVDESTAPKFERLLSGLGSAVRVIIVQRP